MNNLGPKKKEWLEADGCYFEETTEPWDPAGTSTNIYKNINGQKIYIGLADLGEKEDTVNFIYKHRLTNLDTCPGWSTVCLGFNEEEQAWYGWTHRGFGKFDIGYEIKPDSITDCYNSNFPRIKAPFKCKTLEDCKECAMKFADELA